MGTAGKGPPRVSIRWAKEAGREVQEAKLTSLAMSRRLCHLWLRCRQTLDKNLLKKYLAPGGFTGTRRSSPLRVHLGADKNMGC
jgi:hypothetical protein